MSVETYATIMLNLYLGLFLLSVFVGVLAIWKWIRKKAFRYWPLIPYATFYTIFAEFHTFIAYIAYDDPADPNYNIYKNWGLSDFILNDLKALIIGLFIGALLYLYLVRGRGGAKRKIGARALIFLILLLVGMKE